MGATISPERLALLERSWTEAAQLYLQELVPRFDPWLQDALRELLSHDLPEGPVLVPCCGPGHELVILHRLLGGRREVVGLDLSQGMVALAGEAIDAYLHKPQQQQQQQQQLHQQQQSEQAQASATGGSGPATPAAAVARVSAHVADASCLDAYAPVAAVLSVFGLQQMGALAPQALASWVRCLAPGGVAVVVLWPSRVEKSGPWLMFDQVVTEKAAEDAGRPHPPPDAAAASAPAEWEVRLTEAALAEVPEVELLADRLQPHRITWESVEHFWKVMTEGGPWRARRIAQGDAAMDALFARFASKYATQPHGASLVHDPSARIVVLRRRRPAQQHVGVASTSGGQPQSAL